MHDMHYAHLITCIQFYFVYFLQHGMFSQSVLCVTIVSFTFDRCFALLWVIAIFLQLPTFYKEKYTSPTVLVMLQVSINEFQLLYFIPNSSYSTYQELSFPFFYHHYLVYSLCRVAVDPLQTPYAYSISSVDNLVLLRPGFNIEA